MSSYTSILQAAMKLTVRERFDLAEALWQTVEKAAVESPLSPGDPWRREIARRSAEIDAGTATYVTWEQVRERARGALAE